MSRIGQTHKPFTQEELERAQQLREAGASYPQIAAAMGRARSVIHRALNPPPEKKESKVQHGGKKPKRCPRCKRGVPAITGLAFCPFCATDLRSAYTMAALGLVDILNDVTRFYPEAHRDAAVSSLNKAIELLREIDRK